jgi:hypothetical protein
VAAFGVWGMFTFVLGPVLGIDGMDGSASALAPPGWLRKADSRRVCSGEVACCRSGVTVISCHVICDHDL